MDTIVDWLDRFVSSSSRLHFHVVLHQWVQGQSEVKPHHGLPLHGSIRSEFEETRMDELGIGDVAVPSFLGVFPPA